MAIYSLTTGDDPIPGTTGNDTVNATSSTLTSGDTLNGDAGTDTLALTGGGTFRIDQLALFTGFEAVTITNVTNSHAFVYLGSYSGAVTANQSTAGYVTYLTAGSGALAVQRASGILTVISNTSSDWNAANTFSGGNIGLQLYGQTYDLTVTSFNGADYSVQGGNVSGQTITINSAVAGSMLSFAGGGSGSVLTTSDATLNLTNVAITGYTVTSTNASGTTFTVNSLNTALQVRGGIGSDKLYAPTLTLTADQREIIFAFSSIETIQDASNTYTAPAPSPTTFTLTAGTDIFTGTTGNDTFRATADRLNSTDSLNGDSGNDTLALYGSGTFRLDQLASFTGFEAVTATNSSNSNTFLYLGSYSGSVTTNQSTAGYTTYLYVGSGALAVQRTAGNLFVTSDTSSDWNATSTFSGGLTTIYLYGQTYNLVGNTFNGNGFSIYGGNVNNQAISIDDAVASHFSSFTGGGVGSTLTTAAATLNLTNVNVSGYNVVSTNATGTLFTVNSLNTALQVRGGIGNNDRLYAPTLTLTADQRETIFAFSSIETIQDATNTYTAPAPSPTTFTLTAGTDTFTGTTGNDTFRTTAERLNATDSLNGDAGTDTLALYGSGEFYLQQLASFTGFEALTINNGTTSQTNVYLGSFAGSVTSNQTGNNYTYLFLGSGALAVQRAVGNLTVVSYSSDNWNPASTFSGGNATLFLYGQAYDLTGNLFNGVSYSLYGGNASNQTITINGAVTSHFLSMTGGGSGSVLRTSDATLDLSNISVNGYTVTSINSAGTTFTVNSLATALQVQGGIGNDTLIVTGLTLTQQQRDTIFGNGSIEIIKDQSGNTYTTPYPTVEAFLTSDTGVSSTDGITSNAAISGTGDANAVVTIRVDGILVGTTNANAQGQWSYTPTNLSEGVHTVSASETNVGGYTRISTVKFTLDTTAPSTTNRLSSDTGLSSSDLITSNSALTGTTQANSTVSLVIDGGTPVMVTANSSGVWSYTPPGLTQGSHTVLATATDPAGNIGTASSLTFTLDSIAPSVSIGLTDDSGTAGDLVTNNAAISGTTQANASVELQIDGGNSNVWNRGYTVTVVADSSGAWSYTPSSLSQGSHTIVATPTDRAGNVGSSSSLTFTFNNVAPTVTAALVTDSGTSGDTITNSAALTGTADANSTVSLVIDGGSPIIVTANSSGVWTYTPSNLSQGQHTVIASQTDSAGNIGTSQTLSFTLDSVVPVVTAALVTDSGTLGDTITNSAALTGTADANSTVSLVIDGDTANAVTVTANSLGVWTYTPSNLSQGQHTVVASQTDLAGNTGTSQILTFTLDGTMPTVTALLVTDSGTAGDNITNSAALTGTADANSTVSLVIDGDTANAVNVSTNSSGVWTYTPSNLSQGQHTVVASQQNTAGNTGTSLTLTFTLDSTAPSVAGPVTGTATEAGTAVTLDALANVSDQSGNGMLSVVTTSLPSSLPAGVTFDAVTQKFTLDSSNAAYRHLAAGAPQVVTVTYDVTDGANVTAASVSWTITGINTAPVVSGDVTASINEDSLPSMLNALANASDPDDGQTSNLTVTGVPTNLPAGVTYDAQTHSFTFDATNAAYQSLSAGVTQTVGVTYQVTDGTASTNASVIWTVTGTNDAPVNTVPSSAQTILQDDIQTIGGLSVADVDSGDTLTTTLTVAHGVLRLASNSGLSVTGDNTGTLVMTGSASAINAALSGLSYRGGIGFRGADTLNMTTSDGLATDTDSLAITVTPTPPFATPSVASVDFGNNYGWYDNNYAKLKLADVNGDGHADVISFGFNASVALGTGNGTFQPKQTASTFFGVTGGWNNDDYAHREVADINGDGRADIVGFGLAGAWVSLGKADGTFNTANLVLNDFGINQGWSSDNYAKRVLADVNGDGRADIVGFGNSVYVSLGKADGTFQAKQLASTFFGVTGGWNNDQYAHREVADVNGDGRADIVGFGLDGTWVSLGKADGSFNTANLVLNDFGINQGWNNNNVTKRVLADVNGDGRADIIGFGNLTYVSLGKTDGTFAAKELASTYFGITNGWLSDLVNHREVGDVDGDGLADIIGFGAGGTLIAQSHATSAIGGIGAQTFTATAAADAFTYTNANQSAVGAGDTVVGFDAANDTFVFSNMSGTNGFTGSIDYIGSGNFTGMPGTPHSEARLDTTGGAVTLQIDVNGDGLFGAHDIEIHLASHTGPLTSANFMLVA